MGMLRRGLAAATGAIATQMGKNYERDQEMGARKDLASFEADLRQKMQEKQNAWLTGERVAGQEFTGERDRLGREHTSEEARLGRQHQGEQGDKNRAIQQGQLDEQTRHNKAQEANARSQLAIAQRTLANAEKVKDLPASVKAELDFLKAQAAAAEKSLGEAMTPEQRGQIQRRIDAITTRVQGLLGSSPKDVAFDPNKPPAEGGKADKAAKADKRVVPEDPVPAVQPTGGGKMGESLSVGASRAADAVTGLLQSGSDSVARGRYEAMKKSIMAGKKLSPEAQQQYEELRKKFE